MTVTILSDNRSTDSRRFPTEHGLSVLLHTHGHNVLLDTGASDLFVRNARELDIDLSSVDYVFLSHGHADHAGGLTSFLIHNHGARILVSPYAVSGHFFSKRNGLHSITAEWPMREMEGRTLWVEQTQQIVEGMYAIAGIPHTHEMPLGNSNLYVSSAQGELILDDFRHEMALYLDGFLFTGCAHSGLENILDACPWPVHTVLGGFHLLDSRLGACYETSDVLVDLARRLVNRYPHTTFYTSHCTGDVAFRSLSSVMGDRLRHFSCGMQMEI